MSGNSRVEPHGRRLRGDDLRGVSPRGARALTAVLPSGRLVWLRIDRPLTPLASAVHLEQQAEQAAHWHRAASASRRDAINRLKRQLAADAERVGDAQIERAR